MTEEEIKELELRKEMNQKEYERLQELAKDFEYLLDGEKDILLKDLYYERLLTREEIEIISKRDTEYYKQLLIILKDYVSSLEQLVSEKKCDIAKTLENF